MSAESLDIEDNEELAERGTEPVDRTGIAVEAQGAEGAEGPGGPERAERAERADRDEGWNEAPPQSSSALHKTFLEFQEALQQSFLEISGSLSLHSKP